jgi:molybdenum cofactor cytidylyltransferase
VPDAATLIVNVVGFGALGTLLDDDHVYNARGLANAAGVQVGDHIDVGVMAAALMMGAQHAGGRRFVALMNGTPCEGYGRLFAQRIARFTLVHADVERVIIGAVQDDDPICEVRRRVCAIVLAAGLSKRMGRQKVMLPWGDRVVLTQVLRHVRATGVDDVLVVTGANAEAVALVARQGCALTVHNAEYATGEMLSSLQTGLRAALNTDAAAALVVLGDQPSIQHRNVRAVMDAYAQGRGTIIAPSHAMRRGHPILIDRMFWSEILALQPGSAPRDVINRHADSIGYVETDDSVLRDIDTPEAYTEEYRRAFGTDPQIE